MRLSILVGMLLVVSSSAFAKRASYRPGLDVYSSRGFGSVKFEEHFCRDTGAAMETCYATSESMASVNTSAGLFLQKPISSKFYLKVFDLDWGLTLPLDFQTLSTDLSKNENSTYSVDADGNIILREAPVAIDLSLYGIQPSIYAQAGLTIPYLPWIIFRVGGGPQLTYGRMLLDKRKHVTFYSISPGIYGEILLVPLRLKLFSLTAYAKVLGGGFETKLKVIKGEDYGYSMGSGSLSFGLRLHLN
jgi:hypothetical protein